MFSISDEHVRQRGQIRLILTAPFIYAMVIPLGLMDLCISFYQFVCFPAYGIPWVKRKKYVQLVRRGDGLPWFDRFNCTYCSYANGVCAYMRAVLIETEKYWCPIKYKMRVGYQPPHPQGTYAEDGNLKELKTVIQGGRKAPEGEA
jgi:hypothetical protein